jgi:hypothetical protein
MWGDYHLLELCLLITRMANSGYYTFFQAFASAGKKGTEDAG